MVYVRGVDVFRGGGGARGDVGVRDLLQREELALERAEVDTERSLRWGALRDAAREEGVEVFWGSGHV